MVSSITSHLKKHFGLVFFLLFYFLYVFFTYKLVPITSDEEYRYKRGQEQLYYFQNSVPLQNYFLPSIEPDTYYFYVTLLNLFNPKFYYEWFHLQNMLFASIIFVVAYFLVYEYSKKTLISLIGPILIFLTPSFSGHIGFNPIDMPFAVLFLLNLYLIYKFQNKGFSFTKIIILGFSFWLLLGIRPLGFQIFLLYIIFQLFILPKDNKFQFLLTEAKNLILIGFISIFLLTISWPYLGINFFKNLPEILLTNASYNKWSNLIIYNGEFISSNNRPWEYLFTYMFLTTPLFILFLSVFAIFKNLTVIKKFLITAFLLNIFLYLLIQPVIYNGMRHFIFLIPLLVILGCFGLLDFLNSKINKNVKFIGYSILIVSFILTIYSIFKLFPLHYSYFNEISGGTKSNLEKYETDYWGGSYRKASEYIRDNIATDNPYDVKVYSCNVSYSMDYYSHKKFIMTINKDEANYIVCTIPEDKRRNLSGEVIKTINLDNSPYINIRKVK